MAPAIRMGQTLTVPGESCTTSQSRRDAYGKETLSVVRNPTTRQVLFLSYPDSSV